MSYNSELPGRTLLTPHEVALFFGLPSRTVYRWHRMGVIAGVKIGRILRIYRISLVENLRLQRQRALSPRPEEREHETRQAKSEIV